MPNQIYIRWNQYKQELNESEDPAERWDNLPKQEQLKRVDQYAAAWREVVDADNPESDGRFIDKDLGRFTSRVKEHINKPDELKKRPSGVLNWFADASDSVSDKLRRTLRGVSLTDEENARMRQIADLEYERMVIEGGRREKLFGSEIAGELTMPLSMIAAGAGIGTAVAPGPGTAIGMAMGAGGAGAEGFASGRYDSAAAAYWAQLDQGVDPEEAWARAQRIGVVGGTLQGLGNAIPIPTAGIAGKFLAAQGAKLAASKAGQTAAGKAVTKVAEAAATRGGVARWTGVTAGHMAIGAAENAAFEVADITQERVQGVDTSAYRGTPGNRITMAAAMGAGLVGAGRVLGKAAKGFSFADETFEGYVAAIDQMEKRVSANDIRGAEAIAKANFKDSVDPVRAATMFRGMIKGITLGNSAFDTRVSAKRSADGSLATADTTMQKNGKVGMLRFFQDVLRGNKELQVGTVLHEGLHPYLDVLPEPIVRRLFDIHVKEVSARKGPLFDDAGNLRKGVEPRVGSSTRQAQRIESILRRTKGDKIELTADDIRRLNEGATPDNQFDLEPGAALSRRDLEVARNNLFNEGFREWFSERGMLKLHSWATRRADTVAKDPVGRIFGNLRTRLELMGRALGLGNQLESDMRNFFDQGDRYAGLSAPNRSQRVIDGIAPFSARQFNLDPIYESRKKDKPDIPVLIGTPELADERLVIRDTSVQVIREDQMDKQLGAYLRDLTEELNRIRKTAPRQTRPDDVQAQNERIRELAEQDQDVSERRRDGRAVSPEDAAAARQLNDPLSDRQNDPYPQRTARNESGQREFVYDDPRTKKAPAKPAEPEQGGVKLDDPNQLELKLKSKVARQKRVKPNPVARQTELKLGPAPIKIKTPEPEAPEVRQQKLAETQRQIHEELEDSGRNWKSFLDDLEKESRERERASKAGEEPRLDRSKRGVEYAGAEELTPEQKADAKRKWEELGTDSPYFQRWANHEGRSLLQENIPTLTIKDLGGRQWQIPFKYNAELQAWRPLGSAVQKMGDADSAWNALRKLGDLMTGKPGDRDIFDLKELRLASMDTPYRVEDGQIETKPIQLWHGTNWAADGTKADLDSLRNKPWMEFKTHEGRKPFNEEDAKRPPFFMSGSRDFAQNYPGNPRQNLYHLYGRAKKLWDFQNPAHVEDAVQWHQARNQPLADYKNTRAVTDAGDQRFELSTGMWTKIESEGFQRFLREEGYDGFTTEEGGSKNYALYDSKDVKLGEFGVATYKDLLDYAGTRRETQGTFLEVPQLDHSQRMHAEIRAALDTPKGRPLPAGQLEGGRIRTIAEHLAKLSDKKSVGWTSSTINAGAKRMAEVLRLARYEFPEFNHWYGDVLQNAMEVFEELDPDVKLPDNRAALILVLAVASNGAKVKEQTIDGWGYYQGWKKTGSFLSGKVRGSSRADAIRNHLLLAEKMSLQLGGMENLGKFLSRKGTVKDLRKALSELGWSKDDANDITGGELVDEQVPFSLIFGPKLGSFFNNMNGDLSTVTMDRWFMRTVGRTMGTQLGKVDPAVVKQKAQRLTKAANAAGPAFLKKIGVKGKVSDIEQTKLIHNYFTEKKNRLNLSPAEDEFRKAANAYFKVADGKTLIEAPMNGNHRRWIRKVMGKALKQFNEETNLNLTPAEAQALLWYYEKRVHNAFGSRQTDDNPDYASAAAELFRIERGTESTRYKVGHGIEPRRDGFGSAKNGGNRKLHEGSGSGDGSGRGDQSRRITLDPDLAKRRGFPERIEGIDPSVKQTIDNRPDIKFYEPQPFGPAKARAAITTPEERRAAVERLHARNVEPPDNIDVPIAIAHLLDQLVRGDDAGVSDTLEALAKNATTAAQMLAQMRILKAKAPVANQRLKLVEKLMGERQLKPEQRQRLLDLLHEDDKARIAYEHAVEKALETADEADIERAIKLEDVAHAAALKSMSEALSRLPAPAFGHRLLQVIQGTLLTPLSIIRNLWHNYASGVGRLGARAGASATDTVHSILTGSERSVKSPISFQEMQWFLRGSLRGAGEAKRIAKYGNLHGKTAGEVVGGFQPLKALQQLITNDLPVVPTKGGGQRVSYGAVAERLFDAVFGVSAEPMLRGLAIFDEVAKSGFRESRASQEFRLAGGQRGTREYAEARLRRGEIGRLAEKTATEATFQQGEGPAAIASGAEKAINQHFGGLGNLVWRLATSPYMRTPINVAYETATFAVPGVAVARMTGSIRKAYKLADKIQQRTDRNQPVLERDLAELRDARRDAHVSAGKVMMNTIFSYMGASLISNGLISGGPDDRKVNRLRSSSDMGYYRLNLTGLRRWMNGGDGRFQEGDSTVRLDILGTMGVAMGIMADIDQQKAHEDRRAISFNSDFVTSLIGLGRFMKDTTMLANVQNGLMALERNDGTVFLQGVMNQLASAIPTWSNNFTAWHMAASGDQIKRDTYDKDWRTMLGKVIDFKQGEFNDLPVKRDIWGRPQRTVPEGVNPFFHGLVDISKRSKGLSSPETAIIERLFQATRNPDVIPSWPDRIKTYKGEGIYLTDELYDSHVTVVQEAKRQALLRTLPRVANMPAEQGIEVIKKQYEQASGIVDRRWRAQNRQALDALLQEKLARKQRK